MRAVGHPGVGHEILASDRGPSNQQDEGCQGAGDQEAPTEQVEGGREIERPVDLATTPLYVRAGAIVPLGPIKQYTGERVVALLTLQIYPDADGRFLLYEDDGVSFDYRRGEWTGIRVAWNDRQRHLTLRLAEGSRMLPPQRREIEVRLASAKTNRHVVFTGQPLEIKF